MDQEKLKNINIDPELFKETFKEKPVFSDEEYKMFREKGLTEEEIATLEDAERLAQVAEVLPDDPATLEQKIKELSETKTTAEGLKYLLETAKNDPKTFVQMMAFAEAMEHVDEVPENSAK